MKHCPSCGNTISYGDKFCSQCGSNVRSRSRTKTTVGVLNGVQVSEENISPWYDETCPVADCDIKINDETGQVACQWYKPGASWGDNCTRECRKCVMERRYSS